ncbi:hypothetical protein BDR06DRAFT_972295 [Suillus hirtellus]|nr:hypothetical protein BDR06DRAFT_972295 [Suillus hirtellus]
MPLVNPAQQPAPKPFNLGFNLLVPSKATPLLTTSSQPFNFGFNLPHATLLITRSEQVLAQEDTLRDTLPQPTQQPAPKPFNLDYDINNRSFQFGWCCNLPLLFSPVAFPPPAIADAAPGPSMPSALPLTGEHLDQPTIGSLVGDAKHAAIDILRCLGGEEFDHLAQIMVSGALGLEDDVQDPNPNEVLENNRVMLMAFFEIRDQLTRIFKDLISLCHLTKVHEQILPAVESLLHEVDWIEAESTKELELILIMSASI